MLTSGSTVIAPTHIAFAADDRTQVRDCYTNALKAGGRPSGAPSYRNNECSCFNAAVEDLDGNTIEFIFRENGPCHEEPSHADEEHSRMLTWQDGVSRGAAAEQNEDAASVASKAKSKAPEVIDAAKEPSIAEPAPEPAAEAPAASKGVSTFISALSSGITPKGVLGGVIGAVAVGAVGYAFYQSEQDSARAEAAHEALMASYERGRAPAYAPTMKRSMSAAAPRTARPHRNYSTTESIAPPPRQHRNFSVTESRIGPRPPSTKVPTQAPTALRAIEARAFDRDSEIQSVMSKHTSKHPQEIRMLEAGPADRDSEIQTVLSRHTSRHLHESRAPEALAIDDRKSEAQTVLSRQTSRRPESRALDAGTEVQAAMSMHSSRRPQALRALDADSEIQAATSRATTRRPQVSRSQTFDAAVYSPAPSSVASRSRAPPQRSATLTDDPTARNRLFLEGPKDLVPSSNSLRGGREDQSGTRRIDSGASGVSHRSSRWEIRDDDEARSQASTVRHVKRDSSRYDGSRHEGSKHGGSRHEGSRHEGSRHGGSSYEGSRYEGSRHEGSRHGSSHHDGASRSGLLRDPDTLSDASTIKASRRDSAALIPFPASKANSKVSRTTAAEYRLPDSPVPSYYYPPSEQPKSATRAQSQVSATRVPLPASRAPSHASASHPPVESSRRGSQASASASHASRRPSHASGSAAGVPLPSSLASGRGYEDPEDDGLGDTKTVVPDDSISCVDFTQPKAPRSDYSRHSERSHRSHRSHRSKHTHRHDDEKSRAARTVVPEDSISSVGSNHHSHRSDRKSHHSVSHDHAIGAVFAMEKERERELEKENLPLDARTILPEDSISSVGAPARSEHSHRSERERDDKKSHHSSSRSSRHGEERKKHKEKERHTASEAGKSDVTVKAAKSIFSAITLPGRLGGNKEKDEEKRGKRSVASYA
jgi:hypothetical protein